MIVRLAESLEASVAEAYERYRHYKETSGFDEIAHALKREYLHRKIGSMLTSPALREGGKTNTVEVLSDAEGTSINIEAGVLYSLGDCALFDAGLDISRNDDGSISHVVAHFQKHSGLQPDYAELHYASSDLHNNLSVGALLGCVRYAQQQLDMRTS